MPNKSNRKKRKKTHNKQSVSDDGGDGGGGGGGRRVRGAPWWKHRKKRKTHARVGISRSKYWVQDCEESSPFLDVHEFDVTVMVSRCQLRDDYRHPTTTEFATALQQFKEDAKETANKSEPGASELKDDAVEGAFAVVDNQPISKLRPENNEENNEGVDDEKEGVRHHENPNTQEAVLSEPTDVAGPLPTIEEESSFQILEKKQAPDPLKCEYTKSDPKDDTLGQFKQKAPTVGVLKHASSRGPLTYNIHNQGPELPNGDCGDGVLNPHAKTEVADKYWAQRRRLFTLFDQGIQLDREGWFSVTPEAIANHIAERLAVGVSSSATTESNNAQRNTEQPPQERSRPFVVLDAFVGMGGNAIAFARHPKVSLVVCVDIDQTRLQMAAANCRIYNIPTDKVLFVNGDACEVLSRYQNGLLISTTDASDADEDNPEPRDSIKSQKLLKKEEEELAMAVSDESTTATYRIGNMNLLPSQLNAVFLSPPWGGQDYEKVGYYDLTNISLLGATTNTHNNEKSRSTTTNIAAANGEDLLKMAVNALPMTNPSADEEDPGGRIAYLLPRNTNGISLAQSAWKAGLSEIELEQNFLWSKLKTLTMYCGQDSVQK